LLCYCVRHTLYALCVELHIFDLALAVSDCCFQQFFFCFCLFVTTIYHSTLTFQPNDLRVAYVTVIRM